MNDVANYYNRIADRIEAVRSAICPYGAGEFETCDCKRGLTPDTNLSISEKTGCPELRDIVKAYRKIAGNSE